MVGLGSRPVFASCSWATRFGWGPINFPEVWALHERAASNLGVARPPLFVTQFPVTNALTFGMRSPIVVVSSSLVMDYRDEEVEAVLAHELGHVLSDHVTYSTALAILAQLARGVVSEIPLAGLPVRGLYLALLEWSRAAELTCDRAAALEIEDPMVVCQVLMRMAGGALEGMNVDAFVRQATEYTEEEDLFARRARFLYELGRTHPAAVRRVRELVSWVETGAYDRIRSGSYVRRGEEPPPSAEFDAAVLHYRQRFTAMIDRTIGGIAKLSDQVTSWLRRQDREAGDTADGDTAASDLD
ncbi:MAG: M48 family metallopeptidase [Acidimicrobiales bacterium]|nr:M48 family metallopeptidase [Acidimicrobiales bacterium]